MGVIAPSAFSRSPLFQNAKEVFQLLTIAVSSLVSSLYGLLFVESRSWLFAGTLAAAGPFVVALLAAASFVEADARRPPLPFPRWVIATLAAASPFGIVFGVTSTLLLVRGASELDLVIASTFPAIACLAGGPAGFVLRTVSNR